MDMTELKPHQQRVVEEKAELDKKAHALSDFIGLNPTFNTLSPEEQRLLREQCEVMWEYSEILGARIAVFIHKNLLSWACQRWHEEVKDRPLVNKNRRTLDDTWRQVVRFAGGDPDALLGPSHDVLLASGAGDATGT